MAIDLLDISRIRAALPRFEIDYFDTVDSTSSHLKRLGASALNKIAVAEEQTAGRGRREKSWLSPHGRSLSVSLGVATARPLSNLGGLSTVVGVALLRELRAVGAGRAELKWPNDVWIQGQKLCGILVELERHGNQVVVIIGFGINVVLTQDERDQVVQPVTDLADQGVHVPRTELVIQLVQSVDACVAQFEQEGLTPFIDEFNACHAFQDQACAVLLGDTRISGQVQGIAPDGALQVMTESGLQLFHGGEVSLRAKD
jgi:BirA family biotin operon repressor/biotin-[acetyl-CoA-carboxylase] ligase